MFRKIVILVLVISAGSLASAGFAEQAGWCVPHYFFSWGERYEPPRGGGLIGIVGGQLSVQIFAEGVAAHFPTVYLSWMEFEYTPEGSELYFFATCPFWLPVFLLSTYPMLVLIRGPMRRWRRRRRGRCIRCGYSLEGNVSGVCPECGDAR